MNIKVFKTTEAEAANTFIKSVVLLEEGSVQVTGNGDIVIFYRETLENYNDSFVAEMVANLKRNLFHEQVRKVAIDSEIEVAKEHGMKSDRFDETLGRQKEATKNIQMFEDKITALETWIA
tara:strand:+ start:697 stop:1059 length:363 start_codon:yes stop_codon:yes gene_type:complete